MKTLRLLLLCTPAALTAQDLPYSSGSTGADGPFAPVLRAGCSFRVSGTAVYDTARSRMVVFGGYYYAAGPTTTAIDETCTSAGGAWTLENPGVKPTLRYGHAMAWDETRQEAVLHGGQTTAGISNPTSLQTYTWNGTNWTLKSPAANPGLLAHHAMAWDPVRQEVILFGGYNGTAAVGGTWAWNGTTWTNKAPAASPGATYHHVMAWDAARQEMVLFGGYRTPANVPHNETWVWNGATWTQKTPATSPSSRYSHCMAYDATRQEVVMFGGYNGTEYVDDTWVWNGTTWTQRTPVHTPGRRSESAMLWHPGEQKIVLIGGYDRDFLDRDDTWKWDGTDWEFAAGSELIVDMKDKPNGVWNYTSINVPAGLSVRFRRNAANTPVTWLATEDAVISGSISLDGRRGFGLPNTPGNQPAGGPGGYDGGLGGNRIELYNSTAGTPGGGPGGGLPGIANRTSGANGTHQGVYGNVYLIPPTGGSGGGGSAAYDTGAGTNGGGGGGAILVSSSRDIYVNGTIRANGGAAQLFTGTSMTSGNGAGGGIKLVCDRLLGSGTIHARGGSGVSTGNLGGYVRLESYLRPFDIAGTVSAGNRSNAAPVPGVNYSAVPSLVISQVKGTSVVQPPTGSFQTPDVVFTEAGPVTITVTATSIPDGTTVTARVVTASSTINLPAGVDPPVTLAGGTANFTATVPAGHGTIQAFATFNVNPVSPP
jgi:hypothetical protein